MSLHMEIGTVTRALPDDDGMDVKLKTATGSVSMRIQSDRPDLVAEAQAARMSGVEVVVRRTATGTVVALHPNNLMRAA